MIKTNESAANTTAIIRLFIDSELSSRQFKHIKIIVIKYNSQIISLLCMNGKWNGFVTKMTMILMSRNPAQIIIQKNGEPSQNINTPAYAVRRKYGKTKQILAFKILNLIPSKNDQYLSNQSVRSFNLVYLTLFLMMNTAKAIRATKTRIAKRRLTIDRNVLNEQDLSAMKTEMIQKKKINSKNFTQTSHSMNSLIFSVTQLTLSFSTNLYSNAFIPQKNMISNSKKINTPKKECRKLLFMIQRCIVRLSTDSKLAKSSAPIGIELKTLQNPRKLKIRSIFMNSQYAKMSHRTLKNLKYIINQQ